ncbi:hypothetical protein V8F06_014316 [Rhypophila decipiens]
MTLQTDSEHQQGLNESLRSYPISQAAQDDVIREIYGATHDLSRTYFESYAKRIQRELLRGKPSCLQRHADVVRVAKKMMHGHTRDEISRELPTTLGDDDSIEDAVDLCASLLVMTEIEKQVRNKDPLKSHGISGRSAVFWENGSLQSKLASHFAPDVQLDADNKKLGRVFTARNLSQMSGIEIKWTTNLADHLRLVDHDRAVLIFQGASFLKFQNSLDSSPLPKALITETLDTLALLFPSSDKQTRDWLVQIVPEPDIATCGALLTSQRRIENFSIWHDRLVILKQAFDEAQPASLSQWWYDRRNRVQWYTFWVAILVFIMTMVFGLVQSIEGGLQVYLSYQAMRTGA